MQLRVTRKHLYHLRINQVCKHIRPTHPGAGTFNKLQSFWVELFILPCSTVMISPALTAGELRHFTNSIIRVFPGCHSSNNTDNCHCRVCFLLLCLCIHIVCNKFDQILQTQVCCLEALFGRVGTARVNIHNSTAFPVPSSQRSWSG